MKNIKFVATIGLLAFSLPLISQTINPEKVKENMKRVADWQIEHFGDTVFSGIKKPHHVRDWTNAALYVGMEKWAGMADDDTYYQWLKEIGKEQNWTLHYRKYMADDLAVGQMYLELYRKYKDPEMLRPTKERIDFIMDNPSSQPITLDKYKHMERWTWCDALFMAPPVWAKLAIITGEVKYGQWMLREYKATTDHLFDVDENLFYRDNSFIGKLDNEKKIFWSRGNGWVFAGLAILLEEFESGTEEYDWFLDLYKKMARTIIQIQTPQGHWAMSLLAANQYPTPEASGTAFFTYGLAWGINQGILDKETYGPAVNKAWSALNTYITKEGMLGYVQPIGAAPGNAWPNKTEVYGIGAYLAAGSEVYKMAK